MLQRFLPGTPSLAIAILFVTVVPPIDAKERAKPEAQLAAAFHEQSGLGAAEGDSQPVCEFHQRRGQACVGGTTGGSVGAIADIA